jgi:putative peptidoglycan lipid II flippase
MNDTGTRGPMQRMLTPIRLDEPTATTLARGGIFSTAGLLAQGILRFATTFLVGHLAGKAELGVVASAISMALTLAVLWPTSTGSAASKFLARARGAGDADETRVTASHLRRRTVETAAFLAVASVPLWILLDHGSWAAAVSVAALTLTYSGYSFTRGIQFGAGQIPRATAWDLTSVALGIAGLVVMLLFGVRGPVLVLPLVLAYGLYAMAGWPYAVNGRPATPRRRELDGFVALGAIGSLASTGFLQLSQIAAKLVGGDANAGQYAAAQSLATPAVMLAGSLSLVLLPSLSEAWGRGDREGFHKQSDQAMRALSVVMVAVFGSIIVCSRLLIGVVWGHRYAGAENLLPVMALAMLATNLAVVSINVLSTRSQRGMMLTTGASLLGMLVGATIWLIVARDMGNSGVALGYLCGCLVLAAIPITVVWRTDKHRWAAVFGKVALGLAVVGGIVALQRFAHLSIWLDPALTVGFLAVWGLLNRRIVASLPIPRPRRRS